MNNPYKYMYNRGDDVKIASFLLQALLKTPSITVG